MSSPDRIQVVNNHLISWRPNNPQGDAAGTRQDVDKVLQEAKKLKGEVSLLIDVSEAEVPNLEQKKIVARAGKQFHFFKVAVVGHSWRMKLAIDFIARLIGKVNVKLFETQEEANLWLKEK